MWRTFECQSVALHSIRHVPPHHVLHVLQGLRGQWRVEARPLLTCTTMLKAFFLKYSNQTQRKKYGETSWVRILTWKKFSSLSLRMPSLSRSDTLKILVNALMHEGFSCNTEQFELVTLMRSKLMQNKKKYYHIKSFNNIVQRCLLLAGDSLTFKIWQNTSAQNGIQMFPKHPNLKGKNFWNHSRSRAHLLLFWAVQGSRRMENSLLGVVEELRDVLQVFGWALMGK